MPLRLLATATLMLAACQTTDDAEWAGGSGTSFNQAERTCKAQSGNIGEKANRPEFFVGCMAALGWRPKSGTPYADPATAPDPT